MEQQYDELIAVHISDIYRHWRNAIDQQLLQLQPKLTQMEWHILGKLQCRGPRMTQQALAEALFMDPAQLTRLLRQLEDKGLIRKEMDQNDRRIRHIVLVEENNQVIEQMLQVHAKLNQEVMNQFSAEEKPQLEKMLTKLRDVTAAWYE
jgi:DNA-binding MarR family transcriptional regulator